MDFLTLGRPTDRYQNILVATDLFTNTITQSDALRSASYTASSITEVQGCYSIDGHTEHLNGKSCNDIDCTIFKPENPFA
ncbi:calcitonin gene-related peptide type 1 receptor [Pimephales promelas]|nr:calcitonin gene-related peptide type 1 receptor [Pimephales promelas]